MENISMDFWQVIYENFEEEKKGYTTDCWWRNLLVTTSKFGLLTIRQHSATRKRLFLYPQGDRSDLRKQKKG